MGSKKRKKKKVGNVKRGTIR